MVLMRKNYLVNARGTLRRAFIAVVATAGLTVAAPAVPAFAINTTDCGSPILPPRTDLAWVQSGDGLRVCFANAGSMVTGLDGITDFHSGNNRVTFGYIVTENGYQTSITLDKWQEYTLSFGLHARVTSVDIS
jgi:Beta/Gamma crystallin